MKAFLAGCWNQLKNALLAGLAVVLPLGITVWVVISFASFVDSNLDLLPPSINPEVLLDRELPGLGILITVVLVTAVGAISKYYVGQRLVGYVEGVLLRLPLLSGIYQGLKKLVDTLFSKDGMKFRQVVMVEYPRRGIWAVAFLTGEQAEWLITNEFGEDQIVSRGGQLGRRGRGCQRLAANRGRASFSTCDAEVQRHAEHESAFGEIQLRTHAARLVVEADAVHAAAVLANPRDRGGPRVAPARHGTRARAARAEV